MLREARFCDFACNQQAVGTCPLCEKDGCTRHLGSTLVAQFLEVRVALVLQDEVRPASVRQMKICSLCYGSAVRVLADGLLDVTADFFPLAVEALRARLTQEALKEST